MSKFNDMIQNYNELVARVNSFNMLFRSSQKGGSELLLGHIQKIYSTHHFIAICLRFPGKGLTLYLGRGSGHEGLMVGSKAPPSPLRVIDRYLDYVRKYLTGAYLNPLILAQGDRVLHLPYSRKNSRSYLSLFYKGRQLYFAHAECLEEGRYRIFLSWRKNEETCYCDDSQVCKELESLFVEVGAHYELTEEEAKLTPRPMVEEASAYFAQYKQSGQSLDNKQKRFLKRKVTNIEQDLARVKKWNDLKRLIESPHFEFSDDYRQVLFGIKFTFPQDFNHFKKMGLVYDKIKGLKRGEAILEARLSETRSELIRGLQQKNDEQYLIPEKISSPIWGSERRAPSSGEKSDKGLIDEFNYQGMKFAIGRSGQGNDFLRNQWAKKEDLWFHLEGDAGAHVIVHCPDLQNIREEFLGIIAAIICDYGKQSMNPVPLIYTQVKNLKGIKGRPGAVIHKKTKHLSIKPLLNWKEIISVA